MVSQIPLALNVEDEMVFSSYHPTGNTQVLQVLYKSAVGRGERFIYIWGASGVGKTHLLQACCHEAYQKGLGAFYLSLDRLDTLTPEVFRDLESFNLICVDDLSRIAGLGDWEEAVFDFFNRVSEGGKRLIVSGHASVNQLGIQLPDLVSRLNSGVCFQVNDLVDEEKITALRLRARQLGFGLSDSVLQFIFRRCHRNMHDLFSVLKRLDRVSLEEKRKLTIPFVKSVLRI